MPSSPLNTRLLPCSRNAGGLGAMLDRRGDGALLGSASRNDRGNGKMFAHDRDWMFEGAENIGLGRAYTLQGDVVKACAVIRIS